jgi:carbon monoxide dehydrogenase subunit G
MKLEHSFEIPVSADRAWTALMDIEGVAACFPGAALESVEDDEFKGAVRVKLGPISMTYRGKAQFTSKDPEALRATLKAVGRDAKGSGTARADVLVVLRAEGKGRTSVHLTTDLAVTGKPAQFGRGVISDVSNGILGQFAKNLAERLSESEGEGSPAGTAGGGGSLDLVAAIALPVAKRLAPALGVFAVVALVWWRRRRAVRPRQPGRRSHMPDADIAAAAA